VRLYLPVAGRTPPQPPGGGTKAVRAPRGFD